MNRRTETSLPPPPSRPLITGEVCVCGVPRRGIPAVTRVVCAPESTEGVIVVEVPLESLRRGKLFTPPALDAFLRVLSVGSAWDVDRYEEVEARVQGERGNGRGGKQGASMCTGGRARGRADDDQVAQ